MLPKSRPFDNAAFLIAREQRSSLWSGLRRSRRADVAAAGTIHSLEIVTTNNSGVGKSPPLRGGVYIAVNAISSRRALTPGPRQSTAIRNQHAARLINTIVL